ETQTQVFSCFRPKYLLILPEYPLNPPRIPDNQASGPPFRRQRAHLACWRLSTGSNTSPSGGFAHPL
ncbi:IS110 family transposase, partial [Neisseria gonorrhoeae]